MFKTLPAVYTMMAASWCCAATATTDTAPAIKEGQKVEGNLHDINGSVSNRYGAMEVVVGDVPADGKGMFQELCLLCIAEMAPLCRCMIFSRAGSADTEVHSWQCQLLALPKGLMQMFSQIQ